MCVGGGGGAGYGSGVRELALVEIERKEFKDLIHWQTIS